MTALTLTEEFKQYYLDKRKMPEILNTWEETWIDNQGVKLPALIYAAQAGAPTVVFIPGTSAQAFVYIELLYKLNQAGFNTIGFDPRGHGRSQWPRGDYTLEEHVEDAYAVCRYAQERFKADVFIMGSSQGGIEAFYLAARNDPLIKGAICHNIADFGQLEARRMHRSIPRYRPDPDGPILCNMGVVANLMTLVIQTIITPLLQLIAKFFPKKHISILSYAAMDKEDAGVFGSAWDYVQTDPLAIKTVTFRTLASLTSSSPMRPIHQINTPLLILSGDHDEMLPIDYTWRLYAQLTCDKTLKIYEQSPHLLCTRSIYVAKILPDVIAWIRSKQS